MTKECLVSGSELQLDREMMVLSGIEAGGTGTAKIAVPIAALLALAARARRALAGQKAKGMRLQKPSGWLQVAALPVRTIRVETIETEKGDRCLLLLDEETDAELQLSLEFDPGPIRELGEALVRIADRMSSAPHRAN